MSRTRDSGCARVECADAKDPGNQNVRGHFHECYWQEDPHRWRVDTFSSTGRSGGAAGAGADLHRPSQCRWMLSARASLGRRSWSGGVAATKFAVMGSTKGGKETNKTRFTVN